MYKFGTKLGENKTKIEQLDKQNALLKKQNDSIYLVINGLEIERRVSKEYIMRLSGEQEQMAQRVEAINKKYQNLKGQYEKAKNHAANFNSADIRRYFADSLR
jgi:chromosome segregation ATPase